MSEELLQIQGFIGLGTDVRPGESPTGSESEGTPLECKDSASLEYSVGTSMLRVLLTDHSPSNQEIDPYGGLTEGRQQDPLGLESVVDDDATCSGSMSVVCVPETC